MKKNTFLYTFLLLFPIIIIQSCSNKTDNIDIETAVPEGYGLIKVDLPEIVFQEENMGGDKNASTKSTAPTTNITVSDGFVCDVKLEPIGTARGLDLSAKSFDKKAATITEQVKKDVRYRLYIFDKTTGNIVDSAKYIRGKESTVAPLKIVGGKEYTIIAYSINSTTTDPAYLANKQNINSAEIINKDVDFMFYKQNITIPNRSTNTLKIKFRHTFSQITTTVKLDNATAAYSYIRNISSASFVKPSFTTTKFRVSDQTITGLEENPLGAPVIFPFIPLTNTSYKTITTTSPTIVNSPATGSNGKMIFEAMTIGGVTRGNIIVDNLKLTPGVKYNLILTFNVPETVELGDNPYFKYYDNSNTNGSTYFDHEVKLINPTYGAQLDIFYLDNSFQLFVNDKPVFSREINFEDYLGSDVIFSDGTWYGSPNSGTSVIYAINKDTPRQEVPIIRLVIDEKGQIVLLGRKSLNETLRILTFRNGVTYTPVQFNPNAENKIKFRSHNWNITDVWGRLYGIRLK
ncbi:fimbrillin family protein [Sphingobacterium bovistauri]|uniref:Fimbrillin-A associated anchor protein Mfa1 and Mfa2 n=1 Tax=Sphingobacterium bovistauri TaxID=2781959 RepID=A0ABS7Z7G2_9SPHI|nr:fimbrillin family protein [Sphingobacterium bovistauri]MCA5005928.1 hypothetical protein [Sphingobacterium bovistauri]